METRGRVRDRRRLRSVFRGQRGTIKLTGFVDRCVSAGLSIAGGEWHRARDHLRVALVVNAASSERQRYLPAGGPGILVGDGSLRHPASENIAEVYYDLALVHAAHLTADIQAIEHPAYTRDRGPVAVFGLRWHGQI